MANKSRPKQLSFRVSEEEWELLQQKISESGMNQQQYILSCVLGKEIVNTDGYQRDRAGTETTGRKPQPNRQKT